MRGDYPRRNTSAVVWLISALIAAFVLELVLLSPWLGLSGSALVSQMSLTIGSLQRWHVWTLLTHSFLHSTAQPLDILFTVLMLYFIGRDLEPQLGARRFIAVYFGAIFVGALAWSLVHWTQGGAHIGPGAGLLGLFVVLAGLSPRMEMGFLFLPVSFRLIHLVYAVLALDVFGLGFYEMLGAQPPLGLTPSAHLGGMLAGWVYLRFLHAGHGWDRAGGMSLPGWLRRRPKLPAAKNAPLASAGKSGSQLRAEVDRILDKINSQGFGALTPQEKRVLDEAKDLLSRK